MCLSSSVGKHNARIARDAIECVSDVVRNWHLHAEKKAIWLDEWNKEQREISIQVATTLQTVKNALK